MKKLLSILLLIAFTVSNYGAALADTVKLPAKLRTVEAYAFYGDESLDVVEIPDGTEVIYDYAFARSGIRLAIIPDSVWTIWSNAFLHTNVRFRCSENSYAYRFAREKGIPLEGEMTAEEALVALEDLTEEPLNEAVLYSPIAELLSTEDVEDEQILSDIAELNALIEAGNALSQAGDSLADALQANVDAFVAETPILTQEKTDDSVKLSYEDILIIVDRAIADAVDRGVEVGDVTPADEDGVTLLTASNGQTWYLYESGNVCYVSQEIRVQAREASPMARATTQDFAYRVESALYTIRSLAETIGDSVEAMVNQTQAQIDNYQQQISQYQIKSDDYRRMCAGMDTANDPFYRSLLKEADQYDAKRTVCERWMKDLTKRAGMLSKFNMVLKRLPFISLAQTAREMIENWRFLIYIEDHNHPNENDTLEQSIRVITRMNREIAWAKSYMLLNFSTTLASIAASMIMVAAAVPTAGASVVPMLIVDSVFTVLGVLMDQQVDQAMRKVRTDHDYLHTRVYGWVSDKDTRSSLQGVLVSDGKNSTRTNRGYFELYLPPEPYTLTFTLDHYQSETYSGKPVAGEAVEIPRISMQMDSGILKGYVYDEDTRKRLSGVRITDGRLSVMSDENGYYELKMAPGDATVTYSRSDYIEKTVDVRIAADQTVQRDVLLKNKAVPATVSGYVYDIRTGQRLSGVTVSCGDVSAVTNGSGEYSITLINRPCALIYSKTLYTDYTYRITRDYWESFDSCNIPLVTDTDFAVYGTVTNGRTGEPLGGVRFYSSRSEDEEPIATTDGAGHYQFILPRGDYETNIRYFLDDFQEGSYRLSGSTIGCYQKDELLYQLRHGSGTVKDGDTDAPLAGVTVSCGEYETKTDANGQFNLSFVWANYGTATPFEFYFEKEGYRSKSAREYIYFNAIDIPFMETVYLYRE